MAKKLALIKDVDLRQVFNSEAADFTPWLAKNLEQLSESLGIEIVDPEIEQAVGDFRLDIVGIDANSRQVVAVENQLAPSDHTHLGQLITYASGIEAAIVIWITPELRQEHQQALSWLNENSETSFFGVEVRAIQIEDSDPAIDFRVRVAPNDWSRGVRARSGVSQISPRNALYRDFFDELTTKYWKQKTGQRKPKAHPQNWFSFGAGKSGITFGWSFRAEDRFSAELYIDASQDPDQNLDCMAQLRSMVTLPEGLQDPKWEELPGRRACRIVSYCDGEIEVASRKPDERDRLISWGFEKMSLLEETFRDPVRRLSP